MFKKTLGYTIRLFHIIYSISSILYIIFFNNLIVLIPIAFIYLFVLLLWSVFGGCIIVPFENYLINNDTSGFKTYMYNISNYNLKIVWQFGSIILFIFLLIKIKYLIK